MTTVPRPDETELQTYWFANRLIWAYLQPDEERSNTEGDAAWHDIGTGDDEQDLARLVKAVELLAGWLADEMELRSGLPEALERAKVEVWRSAPTEAKFMAGIYGKELPLRADSPALPTE